MRECTCGRGLLERYRARLSGPLLDRIDLQVAVQPVKLDELRSVAPAEASAAMRERVVAARDRQRARLAPWGLGCNAEMSSAVMRATCKLDDACERELAKLVEKRRTLSARSIDRMIKVARTYADLAAREAITVEDLEMASSFRPADPLADSVLDDTAPGRLPMPARSHA